jgi:aerobic C4-dicarboxylate transport protein
VTRFASPLALVDESGGRYQRHIETKRRKSLSTDVISARSSSTRIQKTWYKQLWIQVLLAMAIGVALGHFYPGVGQNMQPLGDAFIKLVRMLIAPIIFCTVVLGIAKMNDMSRVGKVALKTLSYFEVLTTIALIVALVIVNLWQPGKGMNVHISALDAGTVKASADQSHMRGVFSFLMDIIPSTVVGSLADGNILQVLFVSVILGSVLVKLKDQGEPLIKVLEAASKVLFGAVNIVMRVTPVGAFGAIAFTVGKYGVTSLLSLGNLLLCFWVICLIYIGVVLAPITMMFGIRFFKLMLYLWDEILICLATTSSEVVFPNLMVKMEELGCKPSIVGLVIPTGYSFNLSGTCLYLATASVFLAQATNTPLDVYHQIGLLIVLLITSKGAAGVSGAAFVVLSATLSTTGTIPVASVALILGVHRLLAEGMVPTNMIGNAIATLIISASEGELDRNKLNRALDGKSEVTY